MCYVVKININDEVEEEDEEEENDEYGDEVSPVNYTEMHDSIAEE